MHGLLGWNSGIMLSPKDPCCSHPSCSYLVIDGSNFISVMHGWTAKICSVEMKSEPPITEHGRLGPPKGQQGPGFVGAGASPNNNVILLPKTMAIILKE